MHTSTSIGFKTIPKTEHSKVLVEPITRSWTFTDPISGTTMHVQRTGLPLMPEPACPLYSLQGATCDPGLVAHFIMFARKTIDHQGALQGALR